ncbi:MAG: PDZ domain-containing protein [Terriglobales bacterium]
MPRWLFVLTALAAALTPAAAQRVAPTPVPGQSLALTFTPDDAAVALADFPGQATAVTYYGGQSWLGVGLADLTTASSASLKFADLNGAEVVEVYPDSPAAKAGIQAQDVITRFNGERVTSVRELDRLVNETPADRTVPVAVVRQGKPTEVQVQLAARAGRRLTLRGLDWTAATPPPPPVMPPPPRLGIPAPPPMPTMPVPARPFTEFFTYTSRGEFNALGVDLQSLTPQLADYFGLKSGEAGLLIASVEPNGRAAKAGIAAGDVLTRLGNTEITMPADVGRATAAAGGGSLAATVLRRGKEMHLSIAVPARVQDWR